jgi:tripartite-type tricarboxylate transporter receptor subunit TctC
MRNIFKAMIVGLVATLMTGGSAAASTYPDSPVTWIVPFTAGGVTDGSSRAIAESLGETLGQPVIVENRGGAGGTIGTEYVARSKPDGYTVVYGTQATMAASPYMFSTTKYDALKDFVPVYGISKMTTLIVVNAQSPFKTIDDLSAYAKANPGKLTYGSAGIGTATHLLMEMLMKGAGIKMTHAPYNGAAKMMNDLLGGRLDVALDYATVAPQVTAGKLRVLATNGPQRHPLYPDLPTIAEAGYPEATGETFQMLFVPAGTPQDRIDTLEKAMAKALKSDKVLSYLKGIGAVPFEISSADAKKYLAEQIKSWQKAIDDAGIERQ